MNKILKTKGKGSIASDSKSAQLAKIIYAAIVRYIKAKNARNREKNPGLALDFNCGRRVNVHTNKID